MTLWKSERVVMGTAAYDKAKAKAALAVLAARMSNGYSARVEWRDEYNDYSVAGVFAVVRGR